MIGYYVAVTNWTIYEDEIPEEPLDKSKWFNTNKEAEQYIIDNKPVYPEGLVEAAMRAWRISDTGELMAAMGELHRFKTTKL